MFGVLLRHLSTAGDVPIIMDTYILPDFLIDELSAVPSLLTDSAVCKYKVCNYDGYGGRGCKHGNFGFLLF